MSIYAVLHSEVDSIKSLIEQTRWEKAGRYGVVVQ
jgi:hypothetical protein